MNAQQNVGTRETVGLQPGYSSEFFSAVSPELRKVRGFCRPLPCHLATTPGTSILPG